MSREVGRLGALDLGRPVDYPRLVNDSEVIMPAGRGGGSAAATRGSNQQAANRDSKQRH